MEAILDADYPALFQAADSSAVSGQRRLLVATAVRLVALLSASVLGAVSLDLGGLDMAAVGAAAGLGIAVVVEVYLLSERPDRQWYESRAAAESVKTLTWRYAVAGQPFEFRGAGEQDRHTAEQLLLCRFASITGNLSGLLLPAYGAEGLQITEGMRRMRGMSLEERRQAYAGGRIGDQRLWYTRRAKEHARSSARWSVSLAALEALGLIAAVLSAVGVIDLDLPGMAGAAAACGVAWLQTRQHQQLATAYAIVAQELADVASRIEWPDNEADWAHFVDEVEEAISREHTLWWASHVSAPS
ncbi:DUF4231 domain-containing protein [Actinomadura kijaniata]|uniref:DUF4231 domain-containing protein n=1 Tax=Actinomadura namibiensis TaxID=182080 RepID=A0A7W3LIC1_ACTNM|nr:DUF4231 domain-containing protein [Actinomadura namibiensis]MBA8948697.1 hypothetical protein [Actinomadura namibiensis]